MDPFEQAALEALLSGSHPALDTLRSQLAAASVRDREVQASGRFTDFWVEDGAPALDIPHRFSIDDVRARVAGCGEEVACLLHVVRGRIKTLEAFVLDDALPPEPTVEEVWYVAPDPADAGQVRRVDARDPGYALRGLDGDGEED